MINKEIIRITSNLYDSYLLDPKKEYSDKYKTLMRDYIIASDNFVAYRPAFALYTIIAGYPWFLDWGRDALIAFEGITLIPRRFQVAKEVMLTFVRDIRYGLVPNGYSEYDGSGKYRCGACTRTVGFYTCEKWCGDCVRLQWSLHGR